MTIDPDVEMVPGLDFNCEDPKTVYDILWSWSFRYLSTKEAMKSLELDDEMELYQAAHDNQVPYPGKATQRDIDQANEFVAVIRGAA